LCLVSSIYRNRYDGRIRLHENDKELGGPGARGDIIIITKETWRDSRKIRISQRCMIRVACCRLVMF
jgi:hypothetical protein